MRKQYFNFLVLIVIVVAGFGSCTVKKRLYQPGYYVEWHKPSKEIKSLQSNDSQILNTSENDEKIVIDDKESIAEKTVQPEINTDFELAYASNDEDLTQIEIVNSGQKENRFNTTAKSIISEKSVTGKKEKKLKPSDINGKYGQAFWPAKVGLILGILAWLAIVGIFLNTSSLALVILLSWLCVLLFVGGAIFSAVALVFTIIKPEKFKGKRLAIAALVVSLSIPFLYFLYQIVVMFITMFIVFA